MSRPLSAKSLLQPAGSSAGIDRLSFQRQSVKIPLGDTVVQPMGVKALLAQLDDRLARHHAERTAAVHHHGSCLGQLIEAATQLGQWDRSSIWQVARAVFLLGANVDDDDLTTARLFEDCFAVERL